jgi:hypothetical protein
MLRQVLCLFRGALANVALVARDSEVFQGVATAARMGDNVIDDAAKVIEQWSGVPPPSWMVICDR